MFTEDQLREKVAYAFSSADEAPQKYIRVIWTSNARVAVIKGEEFPLAQILLMYANQDMPAPTIVKSGEGNFHFLCRPKKHMAWLMSKGKDLVSYHYLDIKNVPEKQTAVAMADPREVPPTGEVLICIAETRERSTIVVAFVNGTYLLRTFDEGHAATLYEVIVRLLDVCSQKREEVDQHGQKETEIQPL